LTYRLKRNKGRRGEEEMEGVEGGGEEARLCDQIY